MIVRPRAIWDLEDAATWYERQREGLGGEFIGEIATTFQRITDHPVLYAVAFRRLRRALVQRFPYAVYYYMRGSEIVVVGVLHAKMRARFWRSRAED